MALRDGDGWVDCSCGGRHWGRHGAAGVVIMHPQRPEVLMQLRAPWTHGGAVWGFPGGARDSHESVGQAAMRELFEELGVPAEHVDVLHQEVWADHGDWSYHTVIARARADLEWMSNDESTEVRWVAIHEVEELELHPGVRASWDQVRVTVLRLLG